MKVNRALIVVFLLMAVVALYATAEAAQNLRPGQSITVNCLTADGTKPDPGPGPVPVPDPDEPVPPKPLPSWPAGCPAAKPGLAVRSFHAIPNLHVASEAARVNGELTLGISGYWSTVYWFNSDQLQSTFRNRLTIVPHTAGTGASVQSKSHMLTISECPGQFEISKLQAGCWTAAAEASIRVSRTTGNTRDCDIQPNKVYYLNVAAVDPARRARCNKCGVLVKLFGLKAVGR